MHPMGKDISYWESGLWIWPALIINGGAGGVSAYVAIEINGKIPPSLLKWVEPLCRLISFVELLCTYVGFRYLLPVRSCNKDLIWREIPICH